MAVLVMEAEAPDLAFVLHTARPRDGARGVLLAELAAGQGETLASGGERGRRAPEEAPRGLKTLPDEPLCPVSLASPQHVVDWTRGLGKRGKGLGRG
jgi:hypothetical protein